MGRLQTIGGNNLFVSNSGDEATDGIYVIQKSLINGKNWYLKDNPDPVIDLAIVYDQAVVNPAINSRWRLIILFNSLPIFNSNSNANNPWETAWDGGLIVNQTTLTNNKVSIKKQNLGGGKMGLKPRTYLYIASGTGLTPNINGLRFYDIGLTQNGQPIFYDETNTYKIYYNGSNRIIALITSTTPSNNLFNKTLIADPSPIGIYNLAVNWVGTPTISAI